jgi:hypothetical protein
MIKDGRIIYQSVDATSKDHYDILLTNADRSGHSNVITTSLSKSWENSFDMNIHYTHQNVVDGNTGASSQAASNYNYYVYSEGRNIDALDAGNYKIEHSLKVASGYTKELSVGIANKLIIWSIKGSDYV